MNAAFGLFLGVLHPACNLRNRYRPNIVAGADLSHSGRDKRDHNQLARRVRQCLCQEAVNGTVRSEIGSRYKMRTGTWGPRRMIVGNPGGCHFCWRVLRVFAPRSAPAPVVRAYPVLKGKSSSWLPSYAGVHVNLVLDALERLSAVLFLSYIGCAPGCGGAPWPWTGSGEEVCTTGPMHTQSTKMEGCALHRAACVGVSLSSQRVLSEKRRVRAVPLGKGCQNGAKCVWMEEGLPIEDGRAGVAQGAGRYEQDDMSGPVYFQLHSLLPDCRFDPRRLCRSQLVCVASLQCNHLILECDRCRLLSSTSPKNIIVFRGREETHLWRAGEVEMFMSRQQI